MPAVWTQDLLILLFIIYYLLFIILHFRLSSRPKWRDLSGNRSAKGFLGSPPAGGSLGMTTAIGLFLVLTSIFFSQIPLVSLIYTVRFLLALGTGCLLVKLFYNKRDKENCRRAAVLGLSGAVIWTGILALLQFVKQKTVLGWWFLGEPIFNAGYTGVKKIGVFGKVIVTAMATFPHSNVLAGFALLSLVVLLRQRKIVKSLFVKLAIFFCFSSLMLSFSFYTWIIGAVALILNVTCPQMLPARKAALIAAGGRVKRCRRESEMLPARNASHNDAGGKLNLKFKVFLFVLFITVSLFIVHYSLFFVQNSYLLADATHQALQAGIPKFPHSLSITRRLDLVKLSLAMIRDHFWFGVGWGCFTKVLPRYWQRLDISFRFLQPVHNVFLLTLSEVGLVGSLGIVLLVKELFKKIKDKFIIHKSYFILFLLFLFDHYFWSTSQGIYMLFLFTPLFSLLFDKP